MLSMNEGKLSCFTRYQGEETVHDLALALSYFPPSTCDRCELCSCTYAIEMFMNVDQFKVHFLAAVDFTCFTL